MFENAYLSGFSRFFSIGGFAVTPRLSDGILRVGTTSKAGAITFIERWGTHAAILIQP
jgi:hypothetical protein